MLIVKLIYLWSFELDDFCLCFSFSFSSWFLAFSSWSSFWSLSTSTAFSFSSFTPKNVQISTLEIGVHWWFVSVGLAPNISNILVCNVAYVCSWYDACPDWLILGYYSPVIPKGWLEACKNLLTSNIWSPQKKSQNPALPCWPCYHSVNMARFWFEIFL